MGKTKTSKNDAHAKSSATTIKRSQILSVGRTRGSGRLTTADMSNAGAGKERAITGSGPPVVEDSAVVGQKIAVDVPIAGLVGALVDDAGITGGHRR